MSIEEENVEIPGDDILQWKAPAGMDTDFPYYLSGHAKDGAPVWVMEFGKWDLKGQVDAGGETLENFKKYTHQCFRRWVESARNIPGDPGFFVISDLDGYSLAQASSVKAVQTYLWVVRAFVKAVNVGKFKGASVINANQLFVATWTLSKPVFGSVLNDIAFYGIANTEWKEKLHQEVALDQLKEKYGGTKAT